MFNEQIMTAIVSQLPVMLVILVAYFYWRDAYMKDRELHHQITDIEREIRKLNSMIDSQNPEPGKPHPAEKIEIVEELDFSDHLIEDE